MYSINQLDKYRDDINKVIISSASDDSKLDRNLIFSLRINQKAINNSIETASEDLKDPDEDYQEFEKEKMDLIQKHGGNIEQNKNGGYQITNFKEMMDNKDFNDEMEDLSDKYEEAIEKQNEIMQENDKLCREKVAEVDWKKIPLSKFPEKITGNELPLSFIEFVYEDEDNKE